VRSHGSRPRVKDDGKLLSDLPLHMTHYKRQLVSVMCGALLLDGCFQMPRAYAELQWKDMRGDRGEQVLVRDFEMCEKLVELRSQLKGCMSSLGWELPL